MNYLSTFYHYALYQPLFNALVLLYQYVPGHDIGVAIIILTLIIRFILYPFSKKSIESQRALQKIQPHVNEAREKYKNDKEKQSQEIMKIYGEHKINPLSSCLPMLIQLPIIFTIYRVFQHGLSSNGLEVLYSFVPNPGHINSMFFGVIDLAAGKNIILAVLAGGLQFIQSWMLMRKRDKKKDAEGDTKSKKSPTEAAQQQVEAMTQAFSRNTLYVFPLITVWFGYALPAGLPLYWIVTTLFAIGQQYLLERHDKKVAEKQEAQNSANA